MRGFDSIYSDFEKTDYTTYAAALGAKSLKLIPALSEITQSGTLGTTLFALFVLAAVAADGKLEKEEYALSSPTLYAFFGETIDYEECKATVHRLVKDKKALKKLADQTTEAIGMVSEDVKEDIITVCLMLCAVDGKVSVKETLWIKQLIG